MASQCCATGEIHIGDPKGEETKIHGLDCYVTRPQSATNPKGVIVILPDVFGWKLSNSRILADDYAKQGDWLVYLPDFMNGTYAPASLMASIHALSSNSITKIWHFIKVLCYFIPFRLATRESVVRPRISHFFQGLRKNEAAQLPIGVAGFCWGGRWATILAHNRERTPNGQTLVDAVYAAHPSRLSIPSDIVKIETPISIAAGALDERFPRSQVDEVEAFLKAKTEAGGVQHEVVWYEGARHGFAIRGSENDKKESEMGMLAEKQAVNWFGLIFAQISYQTKPIKADQEGKRN